MAPEDACGSYNNCVFLWLVWGVFARDFKDCRHDLIVFNDDVSYAFGDILRNEDNSDVLASKHTSELFLDLCVGDFFVDNEEVLFAFEVALTHSS